MVSKPIVLMAFPLALYMAVSVIFNNAYAWQQLCGTNFSCQAPFQVFNMNGPLMLVLSGRLDLYWSSLIAPSMTTNSTIPANCQPSEAAPGMCVTPSGQVFITGASAVSPLLMAIIGIFGAGILVFVALGLHIHLEGASVAVEFGSSGNQPAKLAQALGIGLLIWGTIYGFFGGWETLLNKTVMGAGGIFDLFITVTFIIGLLWFTQSRF